MLHVATCHLEGNSHSSALKQRGTRLPFTRRWHGPASPKGAVGWPSEAAISGRSGRLASLLLPSFPSNHFFLSFFSTWLVSDVSSPFCCRYLHKIFGVGSVLCERDRLPRNEGTVSKRSERDDPAFVNANNVESLAIPLRKNRVPGMTATSNLKETKAPHTSSSRSPSSEAGLKRRHRKRRALCCMGLRTVRYQMNNCVGFAVLFSRT